MNSLIGKRQIILAALVLTLGVAVYLNWQFSAEGSLTDPVVDADASASSQEENYGSAQYVNGNDPDAYFAEAKVNRTKSRDEAAEMLSSLLQDATLTADQKTDLANQATELAKTIEIEGKIENLVKAKGFADCMCYYDGEKADVLVKTTGLEESQVAQINDIVVQETGLEMENIKIVEIK